MHLAKFNPFIPDVLIYQYFCKIANRLEQDQVPNMWDMILALVSLPPALYNFEKYSQLSISRSCGDHFLQFQITRSAN